MHPMVDLIKLYDLLFDEENLVDGMLPYYFRRIKPTYKLKLDTDGNVLDLQLCTETIIIPVTDESGAKSGLFFPGHPLCDSLSFFTKNVEAFEDPKKHVGFSKYSEEITELLNDWSEYDKNNALVSSILKFRQKNIDTYTLLKEYDLITMYNGELCYKTEDDKNNAIYPKYNHKDIIICPYISATPSVDYNTIELVESWHKFYKHDTEKGLSSLTCTTQPSTSKIPLSEGKAKLISYTDDAELLNWNYYWTKDQAVTIGSIDANKMVNAYKYLSANCKYKVGETFYCIWSDKLKNVYLEGTSELLYTEFNTEAYELFKGMLEEGYLTAT